MQIQAFAWPDFGIAVEELQFDSLNQIPYALIMANKYNYTPAYFDVFDCFSEMDCTMQKGNRNPYSLELLDERSRNMALSYLMQAYVRGDNSSSLVISEYCNKKLSLSMQERVPVAK